MYNKDIKFDCIKGSTDGAAGVCTTGDFLQTTRVNETHRPNYFYRIVFRGNEVKTCYLPFKRKKKSKYSSRSVSFKGNSERMCEIVEMNK